MLDKFIKSNHCELPKAEGLGIRMASISIAPFPVPPLFPYIRLPIYRASMDVIRFDMCCIYELLFLARAGGRSCDNEIIEENES